jgi:type IV pilus assembly protein PilX
MMTFGRLRHRQSGFVLMVSLVMVIAITAIAVSLISSSTMDMKMATAAEDREMATHISRGGNDQLFYDAVNRTVNSQNYFAAFSTTQTATEFNSSQGAVSTVIWGSANQVETDCPRSKDPTEGLMCIYLQATTVKTFGPTDNNQINVVAGVAQQVGVR